MATTNSLKKELAAKKEQGIAGTGSAGSGSVNLRSVGDGLSSPVSSISLVGPGSSVLSGSGALGTACSGSGGSGSDGSGNGGLGSSISGYGSSGNGSSGVQASLLNGLLVSTAVRRRFEEVLNDKALQYMNSVVNLVQSDKSLQKCEPKSVVDSCVKAAALDLSIDKNLGYAGIVPNKDRGTFKMGYKGYIQLALRTAKYKSINVVEIHEGELTNWNPVTEILVINFQGNKSDAVIGYAGYFELLNGFKKAVYWPKELIEKERKKFGSNDPAWNKDYEDMAKKTVLVDMLSKWGVLSPEMQQVYSEELNAMM